VPRVIQVGSLDSTRDFIDVRDVAVGLELLARIGKPGEVYNLASGREVSIRSVLETLLMVVNMKQVKIERVLEQRPAIRRHVAKVDRLAALGFHPKYDLNQSAATLVSYYLQEVTHSAQTLSE
jgi:nucleoside-diphosphate-sugar epimerase